MAAVYGVLVAAGRGTRIGFKKQFAPLGDRPMWVWSALQLQAGGVERLYLVVPAEDVTKAAAQAETSGVPLTGVVAGGETRNASVAAGVATALRAWDGLLAELFLVIHDAARPFVSPDDVRRTVAVAQSAGAAILAQPCVDTLKRVSPEGYIRETLPRDGIWQAQTPQVFRADLIQQALANTTSDAAVTDEAMLLERMGWPPQVVAAQSFNFKITTPADYELAQRLAGEEEAGAGAHRSGV